MSRTRHRIDLGMNQAVFTCLLRRLADIGLLRGKAVGIDATTLEANAALRGIVRRGSGDSYETLLRGPADCVRHTDDRRAPSWLGWTQAPDKGVQP